LYLFIYFVGSLWSLVFGDFGRCYEKCDAENHTYFCRFYCSLGRNEPFFGAIFKQKQTDESTFGMIYRVRETMTNSWNGPEDTHLPKARNFGIYRNKRKRGTNWS